MFIYCYSEFVLNLLKLVGPPCFAEGSLCGLGDVFESALRPALIAPETLQRGAGPQPSYPRGLLLASFLGSLY